MTLRCCLWVFEITPEDCYIQVKVPDRNLFTTSHAETKMVTPENAQQKLDSIVAQFPSGKGEYRILIQFLSGHYLAGFAPVFLAISI